jgi:ribosomal protein L13E
MDGRHPVGRHRAILVAVKLRLARGWSLAGVRADSFAVAIARCAGIALLTRRGVPDDCPAPKNLFSALGAGTLR